MGILVYWFIVIKIRLLVKQLAEELVNCIKTKATAKTGSYAPQFESNFNNLKIVCFTFIYNIQQAHKILKFITVAVGILQSL